MNTFSHKFEIQVLADATALAEYAAGQFIQVARESINTRGRFYVALSGGSTPRLLFKLLTQSNWMVRIDWSRVQVYWGDERCVPPDDPDSNYFMARQALLDHLEQLPTGNVHRILGELEPGQAARRYENELEQAFPKGKYPRFDLVLLGLGEDGHTASLFPGSAALSETKRWVVPVEHTIPPLPLVTRISLTLPVINAAANVLFLVSGPGKTDIFSQVMQVPAGSNLLPARLVRPKTGRLVWAVDRKAAEEYLQRATMD
jgi:6-phosphogluconolactonase